jgi:hypothetical protein
VNRERTTNEPRTFAVGTANADRERKDLPTKWGAVAFAVRGWARLPFAVGSPTAPRSHPPTGGRGGPHPPARPAQGERATLPPPTRHPSGRGCHVIELSGPLPIPGIDPAAPAVRTAAAHWRPAVATIHGRPIPSDRAGGA